MGDQQPQQPQDYQTLAYRVSALEKDFRELREGYMPRRELDLQLRVITESVQRVERSQVEIKDSITHPETGLQKQVQDQGKRVDDLLIRILWGAVALVLTVATGVIIFYLTHLP